MEFRLLGGIAVVVDGVALDLGPARQRCVLAALAVDVGRVVSVERLTHRVWGEHPPSRARVTLMSYLSRVRGLLADGGGAVVRHPGGYALHVERSAVDLHRFHDLCSQARARAADDAGHAALLERALALWQGDALTGVEGEWASAERHRLHQQRLDVECEVTDALLRLGHGEELVAPVGARAARWPLDERVAAQFMLALHHAGRTADALAHYRHLRDLLIEQLGADPGPALRELHQRILDTDPALTPATIDRTGVGEATMPVPRQLPAPPRSFTGRGTELELMDKALGGQDAPAAVIATIGGPGGIGKTWLALNWAHRHAAEFPDGHLFVDLRGFSPTGEPTSPDAALFGFLTALGVAPDRVPSDLDAKAAWYRSLVAERRMLIVLDNAADSAQVIPLLPGGPDCTVLVTGRATLAPLIDRHGAHHLQLGVLTDTEARELLIGRLGHTRIATEPRATDELITLCGHHPLALAIATRHAHVHPGIPLAELAAELRELGLGALDDDPGLFTVLSWSLRGLTDEQRTAFALLGIAPGPDIGLPAATSLLGLPPARTRTVLRALEDASLIDRHPGLRHAMHDLVRTYAATLAHDLPTAQRTAALDRVVDFYLHTAHGVHRLLEPHAPVIEPEPPAPGAHPHPLPDQRTAMAWLDAEHPHLLAAQHTAATGRRHHAVWHLAWSLTALHQRRGHLHDNLAVWRSALDATAHLPDPTTRIRTHRYLGRAHNRLGRAEEATEHLHQALALARHHHDAVQEAGTHYDLVETWRQRDDDRKALDHARHALSLYRALDNPFWEADAHNTVGWSAARLGEYDTAREHCQAALDRYQHHPHPSGEALVLGNLGYIAHHTGHHHQALDYYGRSLEFLQSTGDAYHQALAQEWTGQTHAALVQHDDARAAWREALRLYRGQGRDADAERVRRQLDDLDTTPTTS